MKRYHGTRALGFALWLGSCFVLLAWGLLAVGAYLHSEFCQLPAVFHFHEVAFWPKSYPLAALFGLNFLGFDMIGGVFEPFLSKYAIWIRKAAESSFSLYLFHYPLILFFKAIAVYLSGKWEGGLTLLVPIFVYVGPLCVVFPMVGYWEELKDAFTLAARRMIGSTRRA